MLKQTLRDLVGFDRIWLLYHFHRNEGWKPMARPPRAPRKYSVFATRSPYRPNGIGLSCVKLDRVDLTLDQLWVSEYDLIDGTPILDVKPYIPRYDSFPDAKAGWVDELDEGGVEWIVEFDRAAKKQVNWLLVQGGPDLMGFARRQLVHDPQDGSRKRIMHIYLDERMLLAYRTWRILFRLEDARPDEIIMEAAPGRVYVEAVFSGYSPEELADEEDPYSDKDVHRAFVKKFGPPPPMGG